MAAPKFVPVSPTDRPRSYESPDHIPDRWMADRPAEVTGLQPRAPLFGYQGPDQGYALVVAERFRDKLRLQPGENADDAITGSLGVALRRASLFGRAPTVHDLTVAFTVWGFLDPGPPADLVALRRSLFDEVRFVGHHYSAAREIADRVPEETLRQPHQQVVAAYPDRWRDLVGA
jgi:hypothetical protein